MFRFCLAVVCACALVVASTAVAGTYTSKDNGQYDSDSTWNEGGNPGDGVGDDTVTIDHNVEVKSAADLADGDTITVNNGAQLEYHKDLPGGPHAPDLSGLTVNAGGELYINDDDITLTGATVWTNPLAGDVRLDRANLLGVGVDVPFAAGGRIYNPSGSGSSEVETDFVLDGTGGVGSVTIESTSSRTLLMKGDISEVGGSMGLILKGGNAEQGDGVSFDAGSTISSTGGIAVSDGPARMASGATPGGNTIKLESTGRLVWDVDAAIPTIDATSTGGFVIADDGFSSGNLTSMTQLGKAYLGGEGGNDVRWTFTGASLTPAADDVYRLGSTEQGVPMDFFGANAGSGIAIQNANVLTGTASLMVGDGAANNGLVAILANQDYTGGTTVAKGSALAVGTSATVLSNGVVNTPFGTGHVDVYGSLKTHGDTGTFVGIDMSQVTMHKGSILHLDLRDGNLGNFDGHDLWPDAGAIDLDNMKLQYDIGQHHDHTEQVGAVSFAANSDIGVEHRSNTAVLEADALSRTGRGVVTLNEVDGGERRLVIDTAGATTTNTKGIVPAYIIGSDHTFMSYDSSSDAAGVIGYKQVDTGMANYKTSLIGAVAGDIVEVSSSETVNSDVEVYALRVNSKQSVDGAGKITIGDGTNPAGLIGVVGFPTNNSIANDVDFKAGSEAVCYVGGDDRRTFSLEGDVTSTNGLTKFGGAPLVLKGAGNSISGPVSVWEGELELDTPFGAVNPVTVGFDGVLNVDVDLTVATLSGDGLVEIEGNVLTILGGVMPGSSAGTLTILGDERIGGTLNLGGYVPDGGPAPAGLNRSIFELGALAGPNDLLVIGDELVNVAPGAFLEVIDLGGMEVGRYVLIQYADGFNGAFDLILPPEVIATLDYSVQGEIALDVTEITSGVVIPEPLSALAIMLGMGALGRYVRRRRS